MAEVDDFLQDGALAEEPPEGGEGAAPAPSEGQQTTEKGEIDLKETGRQGTTFTLWLPLIGASA